MNKDDLKAIANLPEILDYLGVQNNGRDIICPFHNDRHYGSCKISKDGKLGKCWSCGKSFDIFSVWLQVHGYDESHFREAVEDIARFYGVTVEKPEGSLSFRPLTAEERKTIKLPHTVTSLLSKDEKSYREAVAAYAERAVKRYEEMKVIYSRRNSPQAYKLAQGLPASVDRKEFFLSMEKSLDEKILCAKEIWERFGK